MHRFSQPRQERSVVTLLQRHRNFLLPFRSRKQLRRVQVPEGVSGKVAEPAHAPVDVLQTSATIIRRRQPKQVAVGFIPSLRHVVHGQFAFHQTALDPETQQDVQIVGRLVGLDADEAKLAPQHLPHENVELHPAEVRKQLRCTGQPRLPKPRTSPHVIFPQPALRFMNPKRIRAAARQSEIGFPQSLLI